MRWFAGQSIVEVLIAVGVAIVALLAIIQVSTKSVTNSGFSKRQAIATAYAVEGMEWIKRQRGLVTWGEFYSKTGGYDMNSLPVTWNGWTSGACSGSISSTEFMRCATITPASVTPVPGPGSVVQQVGVVVEVTWNEAGRVAKSRQETVFLRY